jgi:hypothetical protein
VALAIETTRLCKITILVFDSKSSDLIEGAWVSFTYDGASYSGPTDLEGLYAGTFFCSEDFPTVDITVRAEGYTTVIKRIKLAKGVERIALTLSNDTVPQSTATATPTLVDTLAPTDTPSPSLTNTPTVTAELLCTVVVSSLNLRSGPGTIYPPKGSLSQGEEFRARGRAPGNDQVSTWIEIEVIAPGMVGWVNAAIQYVTCTFDISTLPVLPTPTPPTSTPVPISPPGLVIANFNSCAGINNLGGEMGAAYIQPDVLSETYVEEPGRGCVVKLAYNMKEWSAFWIKLQGANLTSYSRLSFDIRADSPTERSQVKIELKRANNSEMSIRYVSGITATWQTKSVPFSDFGSPGYLPRLSSWTSMEELVFTFEASNAGNTGVVYLDNILFEP